MKRIDTSKWKEFRVGKLFDIHPTKAYKLTNKKLLDGGNTPVVVNSSYNNGIGGFSTKEPTEKGRMITFSDTVDAYTIFYQDRDFIGYPHVQGLYPIGEYTSCWNEYSLKFFATIFRQKAINNSFDYSYKFRRDIAINRNIKGRGITRSLCGMPHRLKIRLNIPLNLMRTTRHFLSRSRTQSVVQKPCVDIPAPLLRRW